VNVVAAGPSSPIPAVADRALKISWCLRVGLAATSAAALFNVWLYLETGDWRLGGLALCLALGGIVLLPAGWLLRRGALDKAGYLLLASIVAGYCCGLIFLSGLSWLLVPSGLLVLALVAGLSFPSRWILWVAVCAVFLGASSGLELWPPFHRFDAASSTPLLATTAAAALAVTCLMTFLMYHAYRHITTIRLRLLASFLLLALVPSAAITCSSILAALASSRTQALNQLTSVATLKEAEIISWIDSLRADLSIALAPNWTKRCAQGLLTGQPPEEVCPGGVFALREHLRSLMKHSEAFEELTLVDFSGRAMASTDAGVENRRLPLQARHRTGFTEFCIFVETAPPWPGDEAKRHVATAMPVPGPGGASIGMLIGRTNMDRLGEIMFERSGLGKTGETYLVGPDNLLLTQSIFPDAMPGHAHVASQGLARIMADHKNIAGLFTGYRGGKVAGVYHWLDMLGVALVAEQDEIEALRPAFAGLGINLAVAFSALCLAVFGALRVTRSIATPLAELSAAAGRVAAGDLEMAAKIERRDEIGALAASFNLMTARLRELFASLEHRIGRLKEADKQLKAYTIELEEQIHEREQAEKRLAHQAYHDPLTNLPNRALLLDRLGQVVERSKRRDEYLYAVLFLDLDRFKTINDSLGHAVGDLLLIETGKRLEECVRKLDTVARLGGDEFVIILEEIASWKEAIRVAKRIRGLVGEPFRIEGHEIHTSISAGIVLSPTAYDRPEDLLRNADIAMHRAKEAGRGRFKVFHTQMHEQAIHQIQLENELRLAIKNDEFVLHYQPIVKLEDESLAGVEALIRWQRPGAALVSPMEFIPPAEDTGLILPIGAWVVRLACEHMAAWQRLNLAGEHLLVSVNLSAKQFAAPGLVETVAEALRDSGLVPECLKIEITESAVMDNAHVAVSTLRRLKNLGVRISIDDFGTGYSSLSYLQRFPIDFLKIDRSFVSRMTEDAGSLEIVHTIVTLAHGLRLGVIAEGVETPDQAEMLREMGCEYAQGYFFARPLPEADLFTMLRKERGKG
jgi:diguanylate cyclase (GGDEF)-like protein